ncbi:nitrogenase molybdenum-iron protein subunit beta [uncultured Desulfobacter sp.]|uniref:nitrogenase molybdenum-iron protein subunit beta n=1 Tax=uncultured Desulfobacter sp. TaxID=240139 RepID=UPI002AA82151|nr:nitrogenase molybdenum-iron protein subunit beta [uncultured Desulfobacter sp.]
MLLRHTPKEIRERKTLVVNPAKTCQPIGAMYAALGVHGCLPHSHGSQGCCAYHRSTLSRHYREPVMAATSSFTEGASVFGGQANLIQGLLTIFTTYDPDMVAINTTCLSETIGDDVNQIVKKAKKDGTVPEGKYIIHTATPGYVGSHVTGFSNMVNAMALQLSEKTGKSNGRVNIVPGFVEPADMTEIKDIARTLGIDSIVFPDTSGILNGPLTGKFVMFPKGGTSISDIKSAGDSMGSIGLGAWASADAVKSLDTQYKVPCQVLDLPIGLLATDRFVDALRTMGGVSVPDSITRDRGRLLDIISDMQPHLYGKKVALAGDPDQLISLTEFFVTMGMKPVHIVTGTPGKAFVKRIKEITARFGDEINVELKSDLYHLHQLIKNEPVDLLICNTYGKYIARDEDIPFVRHGFPILDRIGHSYVPTVGYKGGLQFLIKILGALMDRTDRDAPEERFELVE